MSEHSVYWISGVPADKEKSLGAGIAQLSNASEAVMKRRDASNKMNKNYEAILTVRAALRATRWCHHSRRELPDFMPCFSYRTM